MRLLNTIGTEDIHKVMGKKGKKEMGVRPNDTSVEA